MGKKKISLKDISEDCNVKVYEVRKQEEPGEYEFKVGDVVTFALDGEDYTHLVTDVGPEGVKMQPLKNKGV